jgi:hypothetical protein
VFNGCIKGGDVRHDLKRPMTKVNVHPGVRPQMFIDA